MWPAKAVDHTRVSSHHYALETSMAMGCNAQSRFSMKNRMKLVMKCPEYGISHGFPIPVFE